MMDIRGDTDAITVAQSPLDPNAQRLLTADMKMLYSDVIVGEEKRLRDSGSRKIQLKIVDVLLGNHSMLSEIRQNTSDVIF